MRSAQLAGPHAAGMFRAKCAAGIRGATPSRLASLDAREQLRSPASWALQADGTTISYFISISLAVWLWPLAEKSAELALLHDDLAVYAEGDLF